MRKGATTATQCAIQTVSTIAPTCSTTIRVSGNPEWKLKTTDTTYFKTGANTIELATYKNSLYLKDLYSLYFTEIKNNSVSEIVKIDQLLKQDINIKLVNSHN